MAYVTPKIYENVLPPQVLLGIEQKYLKWTQSGWVSNNTGYDYGHNQHYVLRNSKVMEIDCTDIPGYDLQYPEIADAFDCIQQIIGRRSMVRCYASKYHYGQDAYAHRDYTNQHYITKDGKKRSQTDELIKDWETVIIYLSKDWKKDYYGATLLYTDEGEIECACLPEYNRAFIFDSAQEHASSPLSRITPIDKSILVFNTMPVHQKDEGFIYLMKHSKDLPHSGKTFDRHLYNVFSILEWQLHAPADVCKAGLWHSAYGTVYDKHDTSKFTREIVRGFIGEEAEKMVHKFCSYKTNRAQKILESGDTNLMMIEFANLVDQNNNGQYNETLAKLKAGMGDDIRRNSI